MGRSVLFNGSVITRPGAATRINASAFEDVNLNGLGIVGLIGTASGGQPGVLKTFRSAQALQSYYRDDDIVEAAAIAADPSNDPRIKAGAQLFVCYKTNPSTQSQLDKNPILFKSADYGAHTNDIRASLSAPLSGLERQITLRTLSLNGSEIVETSPNLGLTGKLAIQYLGVAGKMGLTLTATQMILASGPSSGIVRSAAETYALANGDTLIFKVDGGGQIPFTFSGAAALRDSGNTGTYNIVPGQTLVLAVNGAAPQTFTFAATAGYLQGSAGTFAALNGTTLKLKVNGGAEVTVTFTGVEVDATTTAAKIDAATLAAATPTTSTVVGGQVLITSNQKGTGSSIEITALNAAAGFPALTTGPVGTGDAVNIAAMTTTEAVAKLASVAAYVQGAAGTFVGLNGTNLRLKIDGGAEKVVVFSPAETSATLTAAKIQAVVPGVTCSVVGGQVKILSNSAGEQSRVEIVGLNLAAGFATLGFGSFGRGVGVNNAVVSNAANRLRFTSNRIGTSASVQVTAASTAAAFAFNNAVVNGTGDAADLAAVTAAEVRTKIVGLAGATVTVEGGAVKVASNTTGVLSSIQVDAASTADTALGFDNLLHSGSANTPADDLTLTLADYPNLTVLIRKLTADGKFAADALVTNAGTFDPTNLDAVTLDDVKASVSTLYSRNYDLVLWVNTNSSFVTAELTKGQVGPIATFALTPFAGGSRGAATNASWIDAYTAMGSLRVNQLVALASADGAGIDTYTFASVSAGLVAHCKWFSATQGRSERQGWLGMAGSKSQLIAKANAVNNENLCLLGEQIQRVDTRGNLRWFPEWSSAAIAAGMRAGAGLGEPLTHKFINAEGVRPSDTSWSPDNDGDVTDMLLNGVMTIGKVLGEGYRIERGITTYTMSENDVYGLETMVQIWKVISYTLRNYIERAFIGRPGNRLTVGTLPALVTHVMGLFAESGAITESDVNGVITPAWRAVTYDLEGTSLKVGVTYSPTNEIAHALITETLVPARFFQAA